MALKNQESCIMTGGQTTKYFSIRKGACQGDPVSAYIFLH